MISNTYIKNVVETYGTPLYLFDYCELKTRVLSIKKRLGNNVNLCYAMKANPFLISYLDDIVDKFEVCSPGEYEICRKENISSKKIVFSGVYKQKKDFTSSIQDEFSGVYTLESMNQFQMLCDLVKDTQKKVKILPRLTSGNQFGMGESEIIELISNIKNMSCFELCGIHFFSGTQKKNEEQIKTELDELDEFCKKVEEKTGLVIDTIEYGPGLFIDYFGKQEQNFSAVERLNELLQEKSRYNFVIELGRYIAATCGTYLTSVVDIKRNKGKNYCLVDGGIHQVTYYGQMLGLKVPPVEFITQNDRTELEEKWTVCGALCTIHDVLLRDYQMQKPDRRDILAFRNAGAYSITEASNLFLSRELPKVILVKSNQEIEILRDRISSAYLNSRDMEKK